MAGPPGPSTPVAGDMDRQMLTKSGSGHGIRDQNLGPREWRAAPS